MSDPAKPEPCEHRRLRFGSGGYYVMCCDCPQQWVARRMDSDQPDRETGRCMTPLAGERGALEWVYGDA